MNIKLSLLAILVAPCLSLTAQAQLNRFQVGDRAVANPGAGNFVNVWPSNGNESPPAAIDGLANPKYLNFGKLNTGFMLTYASAVTANGINFFTANDSEARDPASFSLWGSTTVVANSTPGTTFNLSDFTLIVDAQALALPSTRLTAASASFANTTAYNTYLLIFPTVKDLGLNPNSMQIGDALLSNAGASIPVAGATIAGGQLIPEPSSTSFIVLAGASLVGLRRRK
jgi:hypothetical protein